MNQEGLLLATEATKVLVPEVYKDTLHPAMQELGKGIHTVAKLVNIALTPISAMVWGYDQIKAYIVPALEEKFKNKPKENIVTPDVLIAGPTLEALRFAGHNSVLRQLYTNLLATSMDSDTAETAHPAFVEIIKQLNPDEAKILSFIDPDACYPIIKIKAKALDASSYGIILGDFSILPYEANCANTDLGPCYIENLARLGLLELSYTTYVVRPNAYEPLTSHSDITSVLEGIRQAGSNPEIMQGSISVTHLGRQFYDACIK